MIAVSQVLFKSAIALEFGKFNYTKKQVSFGTEGI